MKNTIIPPSNRISDVSEYYFSSKLREIRQMAETGIPVINLGIGSPDLEPDESVVKELQVKSEQNGVHSYQPYTGILELRQAFSRWYEKYYSVQLNPGSEILPLIGSKEGLMHIAMAFLNEGDHALVPDPGYPAYHNVTRLAGGIPVSYPIAADNEWLPDLRKIEKMALPNVKIMWVNYPHMPTGQPASMELFNELVSFARKHKILLVNDNPYSFILNEKPLSILSAIGADEVAIELNSLSKSHNMAGWRMGMVAGKEEYINYLLRFKSQMDSGIYKPLQLAAIQALNAKPEWYEKVNHEYRARKSKVHDLLRTLNCQFKENQQGLFVWAQIPDQESSGRNFSEKILTEKRVFLTPGFIFGEQGNRYIRVSLCQPESVIEEATRRIEHRT